jgi:hypothetical protein
MIPTIKLIYLTPEELLLEQGKDTLLNWNWFIYLLIK